MGVPRSHLRSRAWLRVLVLLLALLASSAPCALPAPSAAAETGEYDVVDSALRPAPCAHRPAAAPRSAPPTAPAPATSARRPPPAPPAASSCAERCRRTVGLRC